MSDEQDTTAQGIEDGFFLPYNPMTADEPGSMHYAQPRGLDYSDNARNAIREVARSQLIDMIVYAMFEGERKWSNPLNRLSAFAYLDYRVYGTYSPFVSHTKRRLDGVVTYSAAWLSDDDLTAIDSYIALGEQQARA